MKKAKYMRKGRVILDVENGGGEKLKSISQAKRRSREIQMKHDGGLGRGVLELAPTNKAGFSPNIQGFNGRIERDKIRTKT